ncbi:hypothetical protein [[Phormidium ambiguum] IAM M-71]|nr:hypothetical protein [Phormidium ambiguum]
MWQIVTFDVFVAIDPQSAIGPSLFMTKIESYPLWTLPTTR